MYDLVGVVCTPHNEKVLTDTRTFWRDLAADAVPEFKNARVRYEGGTPVMPWKQATNVMFKQLQVMKRIHGGG